MSDKKSEKIVSTEKNKKIEENRMENLNIDVLEVMKRELWKSADEWEEIEDQFRYICFQIFKRDPHNYNGDYFEEWKIDYINENGEYVFDEKD